MRSIRFMLAGALLAGFIVPAAAGTNPLAGVTRITPALCKQIADQCKLSPAQKPVAKPKRHRRAAHQLSRCVAYRVSGEPSNEVAALIKGGYPVPARPLRLSLEFYEHDEADLYRLTRDPCFYAADAGTGEHLGLLRDCTPCEKPGERQAVWPEGVAIGTKTQLVFHVVGVDGARIGFPSGSGTVFLPRWLVASSIWCFDADGRYLGRAPQYYGQWQYDAYYDVLSFAEDRAGLENGTVFPRVLRPAYALGQD